MEQEKMESEIPETNENEPTATDSDWDSRILCSDGNCIGVIGADGYCKECGKKYEGPLPQMTASESIEPVEEKEAELEATESAGEGEAFEPPADDDWANRILCSDGNCIGVIGADGKCKECGKAYSGPSKTDK